MKYSYDHNFKILFTNPTLLRELIEFINPDMAAKLDFNHMLPPDTEISYLAENQKKFSQDLIAPVPIKDSPQSEVHLILLIEFQSKPERFMPPASSQLPNSVLDGLAKKTERASKTPTDSLPNSALQWIKKMELSEQY